MQSTKCCNDAATANFLLVESCNQDNDSYQEDGTQHPTLKPVPGVTSQVLTSALYEHNLEKLSH